MLIKKRGYWMKIKSQKKEERKIRLVLKVNKKLGLDRKNQRLIKSIEWM